MEEPIIKCADCRRTLSIFEIYHLPGETIKLSDGYVYDTGQRLCESCYKARTQQLVEPITEEILPIAELETGQESASVIGTIVFKSDDITAKKDGNEIRLCESIIKDSSGSIYLKLWGHAIDAIRVGDKIKICNAYVGDYKGKKRLTFIREKDKKQGYFKILERKYKHNN